MWKRLLTTVLFLLVALIVSVAPVQAAEGDGGNPIDPTGNSYGIFSEELDAYRAATEFCESPSLECLVKNTTRFVAMEWVYDIMGEAAPPKKSDSFPSTLDSLPSSSTVSFSTGSGAVNGLTRAIVGMYAYPPAQTSRYVADVMKTAGVQPAYAQGLGFASLDPILDLWKKFRNISYYFFIIIFIVIGFMIMFRQKIGGQAAITAQQAIPSIIISLILVTFSYAIAGFLIDLMYLSMFMIVGLFSDLTKSGAIGADIISMNIFQLGGNLLGSIIGLYKDGQVTNLINVLIDSLANVNDSVQGIISFIGGLTLAVVLGIAVVIGIFRLFFELLKSYASIIIGVVTAPIFLMLGAIPGKNAFMPWFKNLVGNLAAFPAVLLVVVLFYEFTEAGKKTGSSVQTGGFMPPFLVGNGASGVAGPLLGFALLLALPELVKKIKTSLGANDGIGGEIAGWAGGRMKNAWSGKMPLGMNAKNIVNTGARIAAAPVAIGLGGALGAGVGAIRARRKGEDVSEGAKSGMAWGTGLSAGAMASPLILKGVSAVEKLGAKGENVLRGTAAVSAALNRLGLMNTQKRGTSKDAIKEDSTKIKGEQPPESAAQRDGTVPDDLGAE
ncbi:MAG: hypothetical protein COY80_03600 [Candidatus Pacebacteria bacterium CG_4_10_14_0_8_um_filter_42_14]|nr:MAG: hypothetical protein COY80_03600 [Candidatus Pacebacteria bacterium CG_4_10_14_0_8_um_filter_42_14]